MSKILSGLALTLLLLTQGCGNSALPAAPTSVGSRALSEDPGREVASVDLTEELPSEGSSASTFDRAELGTDRTFERERPVGWAERRELIASESGSRAGEELALQLQRDHQAAQEMAELALLNTRSSEIREAAQTMFDDHEVAENMLRKAAGRELPRIPELDPEQDRRKEKMGELSGRELDRAFLEATVQEHEAALAMYQEQALKAPTPELRAYFTQVVPVLRKHLTRGRELLARL